MKWIMVILVALLAFAPAASAEDADFIYVLEYRQEALKNWGARETVEQEDILLSLYCEENPADVLVRIEPISAAEDTKDYIEQWIAERLTSTLVREAIKITEWTAPWGAPGTQMEYSYVYVSGSYISPPYKRKVYVAPYGGEAYLEFVVTVGNNDESQTISLVEQGFLGSEMSLQKVRYTDKVYAYLEEAKYVDGNLILRLDTYIKEGGDESSEAAIYNNDPSLAEYVVADNAHIWIVSSNRTLGWEKIMPDAAMLSMHVSEYILANEKFPPFIFYTDGNRIVWMEQTIDPT